MAGLEVSTEGGVGLSDPRLRGDEDRGALEERRVSQLRLSRVQSSPAVSRTRLAAPPGARAAWRIVLRAFNRQSLHLPPGRSAGSGPTAVALLSRDPRQAPGVGPARLQVPDLEPEIWSRRADSNRGPAHCETRKNMRNNGYLRLVARRRLPGAASGCTQDGPTVAVRPHAEVRKPGEGRRASGPQASRPPEPRCPEDVVEAHSFDPLALGGSVHEGAITDVHGNMGGLLLRKPEEQ